MKKKSFTLLLSVLIVLVSIIGLAACNKNTEDKANANQDFVTYRKKIVTVLKDNGIYVNDLDAHTAKTASYNGKIAYAESAETASQSDFELFEQIMAKPEFSADKSDYEFALKQAFGLSLKMSLCLGDGISNYFNETSFFDIPVSMSGSYVCVNQEGDVSTVRYYTPSDVEDTYEKINLDFKSASDYTFNFSSVNSRQIYATGNAQKQFIMICASESVMYSPDGNTFYSTDNAAVVNECVKVIGESTLSVNKSEFTVLKDTVRYTFTDAQTSALMDKYFSDIQNSIGERKGLISRSEGGIKFAEGYIAASNESVVEITAGTEYLSDQFTVWDKSGTVKSLYIPKTVKGIVQLQDPKTGQEYPTPKIITANITHDIFKLGFVKEDEQPTPKVFTSISVEIGSPIFKSGIGHLQSIGGDLLSIADIPFDSIDERIYKEDVLAMIISGAEAGYYKNLFGEIAELDVDVNAEYFIGEQRLFERFMEQCGSMLKNLNNVNLYGTCPENNGLQLMFNVYQDLNITVDLEKSFDESGHILGSLQFLSADNLNHSVTVNLQGLTTIHIVTDENTNVTVKTGKPKFVYDSLNMRFNEDNNVRIVYATPDITQAQLEGFKYSVIKTENGYETRVENTAKDETLTVPEFAGFDVTELKLWASSMTKTITLSNNIKRIICDEYSAPYDNIITLIYNGTIDEFESKVIIESKADSHAFYVEDKYGEKKFYSGENAAEYLTVNIDILGNKLTKTTTANNPVSFNIENYNLNYDSSYVYYIIDNYGGYQYLSYDDNYVILYPTHTETDYTMVRYKKGNYDNENGNYKTVYNAVFIDINIEITVTLSPYMDMDIYLNGENESHYIYLIHDFRYSIFDAITIAITDKNTQEERRCQIKIKWELNENYDLQFAAIEEYIEPEKPNDKDGY